MSGERILLRWPMCELSQGFVGGRYRIHLRRWADAPTTPEMRYRVRRAVAIGSVFRPETQLAR